MPKPNPAGEPAKRRKDDDRVDEEVAESFPASDPPSYAGGPHAIGGPRRPVPSRDHPMEPAEKR